MCDGGDLRGASCDSLNIGDGALACRSDCRAYAASSCSEAPECETISETAPLHSHVPGKPTRLEGEAFVPWASSEKVLEGVALSEDTVFLATRNELSALPRE